MIVAPLGSVSRHRHAAAALLVGLDGPFRVGVGRRDWRQTTAAFIPAGIAHALECGTGRIGVVYLFPFTGAAEALVATWGLPPDRISTGLRLPEAVREVLRDTHAGSWGRAETRRWVDAALLGGGAPAGGDALLAEAASLLRSGAVEGVPAAEVAAAVGLSASRLMHRFQAEGVTLRRYRQWERMRLLTRHVAEGESLTMAGLAAGFADSAHLSHSFRALFGTPPSRILHRHSRLRVGEGGGG